MSRLTIFAKGNLDVRDSLHALKLGDKLVWNGVNEILRARLPGSVARVRHETWTRSDALLEADGTIPPALAERSLALGAYPLASQFSQAVFEAEADAFVLSIQPDLASHLLRHRRDGFLFYPNDWRSWPQPDQAWLRESFVGAGFIEPSASMTNFARIVARIRARSSAPILIYNVSSVVPGEQIHAHDGMGDILSTRIRRFNLGLIELSQQTGVSIVDVDMIVARAGADRLKYDALHLTGEGCRAVAEEVVRVLDDLACLPPAEASA
ncbi:MAG: SGNH/GDSL hydrolase family protein [Caulobacterales bacterium]